MERGKRVRPAPKTQHEADRETAMELSASRLAFTLTRTGVSRDEYCQAVGISDSTLSRILNKQTLMSTHTLVETARFFGISASWFIGC